jgi:hypothetical protein
MPRERKQPAASRKFPFHYHIDYHGKKKTKNIKIEQGSAKTDSFRALFAVEGMPIFRLENKRGHWIMGNERTHRFL